MVLAAGGKERACQIDDENVCLSGTLRFSGDLVKQSTDGQIFYVGRKDDMVKRHGKRFHLQEVEKVSSSHLQCQFLCVHILH